MQHPQAEVRLLERMHAHHARTGRRHRSTRQATRLREDFAGGAALAAAWVAADQAHRALAIEAHAPTARWAQRYARRVLGDRAEDLHVIGADVLDVAPPDVPRVDIVAALNFSSFIYHDRHGLRRYFAHARANLRPGGILVLDVFGGPGAMRQQTQQRPVTPPDDEGIAPFTYLWEQRSYDAITACIDCRIHFQRTGGRLRRSAFRYDWRQWTLAELQEIAREAGFRGATVWCDRYDPATGTSDGMFRPVRSMPAREDWLAYLVACR